MSRELFDRIQNLEHIIATLTAQRDAAEAKYAALRSWADGAKVDIEALQTDLATAEKELTYKDEVIDLAHDRAIAAEKVCEAAERIVRRPYELLQRVADHESEERQMFLDLASALTDWRRTKEEA